MIVVICSYQADRFYVLSQPYVHANASGTPNAATASACFLAPLLSLGRGAWFAYIE